MSLGAAALCEEKKGTFAAIRWTFWTRLPCSRLTCARSPHSLPLLLFIQMSFSRSRRLTWISSCHPSPNRSRTWPCRCQRRAWKSPCLRANPTGLSRSRPWDPAQSQRVRSKDTASSSVTSNTVALLRTIALSERSSWMTSVIKTRHKRCRESRIRFTWCFMQMCYGATGLDLSVPVSFGRVISVALRKFR